MRTIFHLMTAALATAAIVSSPAQAKEPRVFSAASAWAMNYADDSCQLTRDFAYGDEIITLALERFQPGDTVELALASDELTRAPGEFTTKFRFAQDAVQFEARQFQGELEDGRDYFGMGPIRLGIAAARFGESDAVQQAATRLYRPADELEAARKLTSLTVTEGFTKDFTLELGPMAPPIEAMQACMDELLTHWGVDVERHRTLSRPAVPAEDPQTWVSAADFPVDQRQRRRGGFNTVRLLLDEAGKPTGCQVQRAGADSFNSAACRVLMEKGRFEPALDAAGQPMPSYYVVNFRFQLFAVPAGSARRLR
jgi:TonB family protein